MPTQEERLAAVEQNLIHFKTDTIRVYQDMAMQMTLLKGLTETTIGRLVSMQWHRPALQHGRHGHRVHDSH